MCMLVRGKGNYKGEKGQKKGSKLRMNGQGN